MTFAKCLTKINFCISLNIVFSFTPIDNYQKYFVYSYLTLKFLMKIHKKLRLYQNEISQKVTQGQFYVMERLNDYLKLSNLLFYYVLMDNFYP